MHLNALLDLDLVAHESEDQRTVLLELAAPERADKQTRPPGALEVVLDRSGSMAGGRLEAAKEALLALIARLDPSDHFGSWSSTPPCGSPCRPGRSPTRSTSAG